MQIQYFRYFGQSGIATVRRFDGGNEDAHNGLYIVDVNIDRNNGQSAAGLLVDGLQNALAIAADLANGGGVTRFSI